MTNSHQWYMAIGGHQIGPVSAEEIISNIQNSSVQPDTLVYTAGMRDWAPIKDVAVFASAFGKKTGGPIIVPNVPGRTAHEIDFKIYGDDLQFVEVELDPGESVVAEAGAMMYMTQGIEMNTVFGDGSQGSANSGIMSKLLGAGKTARSLRGPLRGKDRAHGSSDPGGTADLPEGLVSVRGQRGVNRDRLSEEDRRRPVRR